MDGNIVLPNPPPRPVSQDGKPYFAWPNRQGGQEAAYSVPSQTMAGFPPSAESEGIPTSEHGTMWHLDPDVKEERSDKDLNEYSEDQRSDIQGSPAGMRYPPPSSDQMLSAINCSTDDLHDTEGSLIEDAASISNGNRLEDGILGDGISMGTAQNYSLFEDHGGVVDPEAPPYISEAQLSPHNMEEHSPFVSMATMGGADMVMKKEPPERPRSATPQARKGPRPIARGRSSSLDSQLSTGSTASSGSDSKSTKKRAGRPARGSPSRHPVDCPQCGKTFSSSSSLAKHRSTHSEERKYVCQICGKAFKRQDHLNGHINTHRERKPFPCMVPGCDKSYCDTRSLRRHFELHHSELGPFYLPSPPSPQQAMTAMTRGVPPTAMPPPSTSRDPQLSYTQAGEVAAPTTEISAPRPPEEAVVTSSQVQQRSHGEAMQSLAQFARRAQQQQPQPQPPSYQERPQQPGASYNAWALPDQPTSGTQPRYTVNLDSFFASQLVAAANGGAVGSTQMVLPQQVFSQPPPAYMPPTSQVQITQAHVAQAANHAAQSVSQAQMVQGANQVQMIQAANQAHAAQSGMQAQMSQATDQTQVQMAQAANQRQMAQAVSQAQMAQATSQVQLAQAANQVQMIKVENQPHVTSQAPLGHVTNQVRVSQAVSQPQVTHEALVNRAQAVQATSQLQYNQAANNAQVAQRLAQAQAQAGDVRREVPAPPGFGTTPGGPWQQSFPYELQALLTSNHSQWSRQAPVPGSKTVPAQTAAAPQKPVECQTCGRQFRSLPALNGHMRLHGGYEKNKKKDPSSESLAALTQTVASIGQEEQATPDQLGESAHPVLQSLVMGTATASSMATGHSSTTNPALLHRGAGGNESGAVLSDFLYPSKESAPPVKTEIRLPETTTHLPGSYSALKRQHQLGTATHRGESSQSDSEGPPELERMDFSNYEATMLSQRQQPQLSPVTSSTDSTKEIANVVASLLAQDFSNQGSYPTQSTTIGSSALQQQSHGSNSVSFSLPYTSAGLTIPTNYSSKASTIVYSAQPVRSQASSTGEVWRTPVISVSPVLPKKTKPEPDTMSSQAAESTAPSVPRKRKPPALNIPDSVNAHVAVGPIVYQSHMRSPRALNGDFIFTQAQGAEPPYTPPPMLSPIRVGSGLYFSTFCKNENEKLLTPAPRQPSTPFLSPSPNLLFSRQWSWQEAGVRPKVNVGPNFQADSRQIPECNRNKADALKEEEKAELVFHPECVEKLTDKEVRAYLEAACSKIAPLGGRNKEYAFHLLYRCNGDIMTAVPKLMTKPALLPKDSFMQTYHYSGSTRWNKKDKANFEEAIKQYGKSFSDFKEFLPNKTVDQCVEFYYRWKHTTGKKDKVILGRTRLQARRAEEAQWGRSISFDSEVETPRTILPQFVSPESSFVKPSSPTPEPSHVFCCTIEGCNATFPTRQGLNGHTRVHGGTGNSNQTAKRNSKPDNGKKKRKRRRSNSLSPPPSNASATSHESGESSMTGATAVEGEEFPCRICGKVFHKVKSRSAHMKTHRKVDREEEKTSDKIHVPEASRVSVLPDRGLPMSNHTNTFEEDLQDAFE
ncbi:transcriptional-regulating factor 1-like isoform X1 [Branchiostoma floridae]|uniref:Transcriptional-regulating factor 1-like isoform X1 n=1 Tax=Branchiostoma floridae TaxID=7739 RepID=A0A9J7LQN2_BRAFL|nr:transcriptional-regulating factor 1-like isoform X1 [Branchiostoma floridae]